ncbi:MAG: phage tail tape measure protein [Clostridium sp.]
MSGIAVRVGANTSEFNRSMSAMKRDLKEVQSSFSVTGTQAKLFGSVTDQLKNKQSELTSKLNIQNNMLEKTKDYNTALKNKLGELNSENEKLKTKINETNKAYKDSVKATGENSEASLKLKKELDGLKQEYNKNGNEIEATDKKIQNNIITMNNSEKAIIETKKALEQTNKELKNSNWDSFNKKMDGVKGNAQKVVSAFKPVAMATMAIGTAGAVASVTFEDSIAKVRTIMDESVVSVNEMKKKIIDLSNQTGISSNEIANNVYDAISAGQSTADAVNFVTNSTKLAKAGFAEAGQSLDLLTTILNSYGMESKEVAKVSDILINTQNLGKVTVGELSSSMGKVIPTAKSFGVNLEQVASGYAIMTAKGIKSAETTTYMASMFNELGKSGTKASDIVKEIGGKSFQDLMSSGKTVGDVLAMMDDYAKKNNLSLADLFGSAEAGKASLILSANAGEDFNAMLKNMNNTAGMTGEALSKMDTKGQKFRESLNKIKNAGIKLGDTLSPVISLIANAFSGVATFLSNMGTIPMMALIISGGLVLGIAGIAMAVIKVVDAIRMIKEAFDILRTVGAAVKAFALANPISLIILAIVAVIAILVTLYNKCEWFRDGVNTIVTGVIGFFKDFSSFMANVFTIDWLTQFGVIGNLMNAFMANVKNVWDSIKRIFVGIIDFVAGVFTGDWSRAWKGVVNIFGGIFDGLGAVLKAPLNAVIGLINMAIDGLNTISFTAPDWVPFAGGKHFGVNLPKMNYLYKGGIISSPTAINSNTIVGDKFMGSGNQSEIVTPLDPFYKNLRNIVKEESGQPIYVIVNVDNRMDSKAIGKAVTTEVKKEITRETNNYKKSKGGLSFA